MLTAISAACPWPLDGQGRRSPPGRQHTPACPPSRAVSQSQSAAPISLVRPVGALAAAFGAAGNHFDPLTDQGNGYRLKSHERPSIAARADQSVPQPIGLPPGSTRARSVRIVPARLRPPRFRGRSAANKRPIFREKRNPCRLHYSCARAPYASSPRAPTLTTHHKNQWLRASTSLPPLRTRETTRTQRSGALWF